MKARDVFYSLLGISFATRYRACRPRRSPCLSGRLFCISGLAHTRAEEIHVACLSVSDRQQAATTEMSKRRSIYDMFVRKDATCSLRKD